MIKIYNSLTRRKELFKPLDKNNIRMYSCGPTVYAYPTIGNFRTMLLNDTVSRTLKYFYGEENVTTAMNITDVGHLVGDTDEGEDKMEKAKRIEGKNAWEIAEFYTKDFIKSSNDLNINKVNILCKATDHIKEQIDLIEKIMDKGYAYKISDGIYFDITKYELDGNTYGDISDLDEIREGARVKINTEKRGPKDFALWKFSPKDKKRDMEWESPWGKGFPGWHIECSAMSMKYLGESFDLHIGGEDLKHTHHPNEIAQAEAATDKKPFCNYWLHGAFIQVDGGKMGKSLGNAYTIEDIKNKGYSPMDLRYLYLTASWNKPLNFTWESLESSKKVLKKIKRKINNKDLQIKDNKIVIEKLEEALKDNINTPKILALLIKELNNISKKDLKRFETILGLKLLEKDNKTINVPKISEYLEKLLAEREEAKKIKDYQKADQIRDTLKNKGYKIIDTKEGASLEAIN